jgi:secondary thiamine-phosphate synthase enzyme
MQNESGLLEIERSSQYCTDIIRIHTTQTLQFVDLTDRLTTIVSQSGVAHGVINIQTRHTTTGIVVNEHEPLLLSDMKQLLERLVPENDQYEHDNFEIRTTNLTPDERRNGYAHCRALFLRASESMNIVDGKIHLGTWQRIFLLELDGPREREVSVMIVGY